MTDLTKIKAKGAKVTVSGKPAGQHLWFWQRATPRRQPGEETKTVVFQGWGHVSTPRKTSPARSRRRLERKRGYELGLLRDHEVGINPVYRGYERNSTVHKTWLKAVKAWEAKRRLEAEKEAA